jgi:Zn-dependent peptidase ImmA (M78 family)
MNLLLPAIKRAVPSFNKRPHSVEDFHRICRRQRPYIRVHEIPLGTPGYYMCEADGTPHIYINSRLKGIEWLESGYHEMGHHFLHKPVPYTLAYYYRTDPPTKQEHEAQAFAEIMLIPQSLMFEIIASPDYIEDWGFADRLFTGRRDLYARYAV